MKIVKRIIEGEKLPSGYRVAYRDPSRHGWVIVPFGLHWLIRFWRLKTWKYKPSIWEKATHYAIQRAEINGYRRGYDKGREDCLKTLKQTVAQTMLLFLKKEEG